MQRVKFFLLVASLWCVAATPGAAQSPGAEAPAATPAPSPAATPIPTPSPSQVASPSPSPSPEKSPGGNGVFALVVDGATAQVLLGLPVKTSKGEDLGHVVDVVVARNGALLAAIIDFGGFLGVGSRKIAVDWRMVHFPSAGGLKNLVADLPLDQLREAPAFKPGEPIVIMGAFATPSPTATPSQTGQKP